MIENSTIATPAAAVAELAARVAVVGPEPIALAAATGRVLASAAIADRPSPACDVSAMDGYAIRLSDRMHENLPVATQFQAGQPLGELIAGTAARIFTGSAVPVGCDAIVPLEEVAEVCGRIRLSADRPMAPGQHIRRCGENVAAGELIVAAGRAIGSAEALALATFGVAEPRVFRRVRLQVLVTGNEIADVDGVPEPWQVRDSNGPALAALLARLPWIEWLGMRRVKDSLPAMELAIREALGRCDAILLTGGVSVGSYDFVPQSLSACGCETVFHRLPIRPGKPVLGAVGPAGQAVLGLPGNPVSTLSTGRRIALPVLRRLGGYADCDPPTAKVRLANDDGRSLPLWWYRPIQLVSPGEAMLVATRGSGDVVAVARSSGLVELPPHATGDGPWPYYSWMADA